MTTQLSPHLAFDGRAREAIEFYRDVFGGDLEIGTVADFGQVDSPDADKIAHAALTTPSGWQLLAWDLPVGVPDRPGTNLALHLTGDADDLRRQFAALAEGGTVTMPLAVQYWGDEAGSVIDRFGTAWSVNVPAERD